MVKNVHRLTQFINTVLFKVALNDSSLRVMVVGALKGKPAKARISEYVVNIQSCFHIWPCRDLFPIRRFSPSFHNSNLIRILKWNRQKSEVISRDSQLWFFLSQPKF